MRPSVTLQARERPQAPGRAPYKAPQAPLRCPGAEDQAPTPLFACLRHDQARCYLARLRHDVPGRQ